MTKLSRKTCHDGKGIPSGIAKAMISKTGMNPDRNESNQSNQLLFDTIIQEGPINRKEWSGVPLPGTLTEIVSNQGNSILIGRCPFCGVVGLWMKSTEVFRCNCSRCSGAWKIQEDKIIPQ